MTSARVAASTGKSESSRRKPCGRPTLYQVAITTSDRAVSIRQRMGRMGVASEGRRGVGPFVGHYRPAGRGILERVKAFGTDRSVTDPRAVVSGRGGVSPPFTPQRAGRPRPYQKGVRPD